MKKVVFFCVFFLSCESEETIWLGGVEYETHYATEVVFSVTENTCEQDAVFSESYPMTIVFGNSLNDGGLMVDIYLCRLTWIDVWVSASGFFVAEETIFDDETSKISDYEVNHMEGFFGENGISATLRTEVFEAGGERRCFIFGELYEL